ncbi:MAG: hypothetical protein ACKPKO_26385, partial [Candidatus Fonsibacter sp.]
REKEKRKEEKEGEGGGGRRGKGREREDEEQEDIQEDMKGDPTWICLPPEARPTWWRNKFPNLRRPEAFLWPS